MARTGCAHWPGGLAHSYADTLAVIARCVTACRGACAAAFCLTCGAVALLHAANPCASWAASLGASLGTARALASFLTVCGAVAAPVVVPLPVAAAAALAHAHVLACVLSLICGLACIRHCAHAATCRVGSLAAASAHTAPCAGTIALRPCVIETRHVILLMLPLLTYVINRSMDVYDICQ